jgi:hypothetical protein
VEIEDEVAVVVFELLLLVVVVVLVEGGGVLGVALDATEAGEKRT